MVPLVEMWLLNGDVVPLVEMWLLGGNVVPCVEGDVVAQWKCVLFCGDVIPL